MDSLVSQRRKYCTGELLHPQSTRNSQTQWNPVHSFVLILFYSLRTSMVHEFTQVRAGVLRVIRHLLKVPRDLQVFNELQLTQLLCRSLDVLLDNEEERIQALKLVSPSLSLSPYHRDIKSIFLVSDSKNVVPFTGNHQSDDCTIAGVAGREWHRRWRSNVAGMFGNALRIRRIESDSADCLRWRQCNHT